MKATQIDYCPMNGDKCKNSGKLIVQRNTFFLAEPFSPEKEREKRRVAVSTALQKALREKYVPTSLIVADEEPQTMAIFCHICELIQSSSYGIADISGLNPNVLLELGMMLSLGKPVFVLVKSDRTDDLRKILPIDILWKWVVSYEDFTEAQMKLEGHIRNRPNIEEESRTKPASNPLRDELKSMLIEIDAGFAGDIDAKLKELEPKQKEVLKELEMLLKEAKLEGPLQAENKIEIPCTLKERIQSLRGKLAHIESILGSIKNSEVAFLLGNWHFYQAEYLKALDSYDLALTLKADFIEAWNNKGAVLNYLARYEGAIVCFDKVLETKQDCKAWLGKAYALRSLGRWEKAKQCYMNALQLNPKSKKLPKDCWKCLTS